MKPKDSNHRGLSPLASFMAPNDIIVEYTLFIILEQEEDKGCKPF